MNGHVRSLAAVLLVAPLAAGCATKGALQRAVEGERMARMQADSAQMANIQNTRSDVDAVRGELNTLRSDIAALRSDLQGMRADFDAKITAVESGMQFMLPVTFAFDDASVRPEDAPALDRFAQVVRKYYPTSKITVEGFADPAGPAAYNRVLSERRAESVRGHLTQAGLDASLLRAIGYGEARQVAPGAQRDDMGAELNRRVVFVIESRDAAAIIAVLDGSDRE